MDSKTAIKNVVAVPNKYDKTGGLVSGDIVMNGGKRVVTSNNYGIVGKTSDNNEDYLLFMDSNNKVHLGWNGRNVMIDDDAPITRSGHRFYHAGYKPSPADIGAQPKEATTFMQQTDYVAVRTPTRKAGQYYEFWDTDNSWADIRCGELYAKGYNKVYHTANKPTPSDIGAVPLVDNSSISLHADADSSSEEEFLSLKAGKNDLRILSSAANQSSTALLFNGNQIYHTGKKPTLAEIGAAPSNHDHPYIAWGNNLIDCRQPNDYAGLEKKNNVDVQTWYGFSITNKCANQTVPVDGQAFSVDARTGNVWTKGKFYSESNKEVVTTDQIEGYNVVRQPDGGDANKAIYVSAPGGPLFLNSGESKGALEGHYDNNHEHLVMTSDSLVRIYTGMQNGWDSKGGVWTFDQEGKLWQNGTRVASVQWGTGTPSGTANDGTIYIQY